MRDLIASPDGRLGKLLDALPANADATLTTKLAAAVQLQPADTYNSWNAKPEHG
jgi:hypothetical protein